MRAAVAVLGVALTLTSSATHAQVLEARAELGVSVRGFPEAPVFNDQVGARLSPSAVFVPEFSLDSPDGSWRLTGEGFLRLDAHDANRSHVDVRELGVTYLGNGFTGFVGIGRVFWGVTEVRHLVDIVNQVDGVEDLDGEDRLGQPMVSLTLEGEWGVLDTYLLPYFRERTFPGGDARLRGPVPIADEAVYTSGRGRWHPGFAARFMRTSGAVDIGLSFFHGTSREPRLEPATSAAGSPVLRPRYDEVDQVGLDAQWTGDHTLLKLETITRTGHGERLYGFAAGLERTLYQVFGTAGDVGIVAEIMYDTRTSQAPPTLFDNDLFVGARWAMNDVSATSLLSGPMIDLDTGEILFLLEADRRVGSSWRLGVDMRLFANADRGSLMHGVRRDGFVSLSLSRFF